MGKMRNFNIMRMFKLAISWKVINNLHSFERRSSGQWSWSHHHHHHLPIPSPMIYTSFRSRRWRQRWRWWLWTTTTIIITHIFASPPTNNNFLHFIFFLFFGGSVSALLCCWKWNTNNQTNTGYFWSLSILSTILTKIETVTALHDRKKLNSHLSYVCMYPFSSIMKERE